MAASEFAAPYDGAMPPTSSPTPARTTRCCWSPSAAPRGPRTSCRSWRTSPAAGASRASGSRRWASTTSSSAAASPINDQNRALLDGARARTSPAPGIDLPVYWGNRNWDPYLADAVAADARRRGHPGRLLHDQRLLVVLRLPAVPREPRRRRRGRRPGAPRLDKLRHYFNHPGFVEPVVDATLAALADLPDGVREGAHLVFVTHSIPECDERHQRPRRRRVRRPAPQRGRRGRGPGRGRRPAAGTTHRPGLLLALRRRRTCRGWSPTSTTTSRSSPADGASAVVVVPIGFVSDHMEVIYDLDTEALATAEKLGLPRSPGPRPPASTRASSRWSATCCSSGPRSSAARTSAAGRGRQLGAAAGTAARSAAAPTRGASARRSCGLDVTR